jgi:Rad3-related DNA helicase
MVTKDPTVLISPSLTEGIDLKGKLSDFCIICKIPYPSLMDSWVKARMEADPLWYSAFTLSTIIQMTGRSVRSETDNAPTYILDSEFIKFYNRKINDFPKWWKKAVTFLN